MTSIAPDGKDSSQDADFYCKKVERSIVEILEIKVNSERYKKYFRIMKNIETITLAYSEYFPSDVLNNTIEKFVQLLPYFIKKFSQPKSFTHKRVYTYYIAILDVYLSNYNEKISPYHFGILKKRNLIGDSKVCSYLEMKKWQRELQELEILEKSNPLLFSDLLKGRIEKMLSQYSKVFEIAKEDISRLKDKTTQLLDLGVKPHINLNEAAIVIIGVLFKYYFKGLEVQREFREFICKLYELDEEQIKRKIQEFRERLNKKKMFTKLGLKKEKI